MLSFRRIGGFFGRVLLIYGLFVVSWAGIKADYAALYSGGWNLVFRSLIPGGSVRFHATPPPTGKHDTYIDFVNLRSGARGTLTTSSRDPAYLQTAFLVSLVLATPLPWRRRLWALVGGLILVHALIAGRLLVTVLHEFSRAQFSLLAPGPPWNKVLSVANRLAVGDVVMLLMLPVFIWILVCFRQSDWRM
jgi:hypothetical protein